MSKFGIPYNEIISWLEKYCQEQKLGKTYKGLELSNEFIADVEGARTKNVKLYIDPMLPIDLVAVHTEDEPDEDKPGELVKVNYYTLFWIVSAEESDAERLGVRLQFYQFLLSRVTDLRSVQIYLVIPDGIEKDTEANLLRIAKNDGFGLLKLESVKKPPRKPLTEARSFREHMEKVLDNPPADMDLYPLPDSVKKEAGIIGPYLDLFVREAIDAVAGRTPMQAGKRYINRELLEHVFSLKNVSYAAELKNMVTAHLINKGDDYKFVEDTFSALWKRYFPKMGYSKFLRVAELPLYHILALSRKPYRDHYLHQFQVFILGLCILDRLMERNQPDITTNPYIDRQWLITSSFHDMAYPLQLYEDWAKGFFEESLDIPDLGKLDIKSYFVDRSLLSSIGFIIDALCKQHFDRQLKGNWLQEEKELILFFYDRISKIKHHCILSSLYLLKQAQSEHPELLPDYFVPSALAIVLHHYDQVFRKLELPPEEEDTAWKNLRGAKRVLSLLEFKTDPLTFLLMFCDSAQEWGRPKLEHPKPEDFKEDEQLFVLDKCDIDESGCCIRMRTPNLESIDDKFEAKDKELVALQKFLRAPTDFSFEIILVDKSGEPRPHHLKCSK
jgi:hypothetical protein